MSDITTKASAAQAAVSPKPRSKQDSALHTPSWTDIVAAYHAEGNGDREMLLALLNAKAKEDERLAALDLLRAEQLRAYTAHLAVHGPLYPSAVPSHQQQQPYPHHAHPYAAQHAHQSHHQQHHAPTASSSTSSSARSTTSSSTKTRKRNPTSRSPSLSHSSESRLSSPEMVRTPDDERRMSGLSISDKDALILPPPNNMKRKSPSSTSAAQAAAKRVSPPRQLLPSIADLLPASQAVENHNNNSNNKRNLGVSHQQDNTSSNRATSPRSLQHILNQELRPLMSLGTYRAQTSDVRSSSSDEDELAEA